MASWNAALARASGVRTWPGDQQIAAARRRHERLRPAGWRLHQSDSAALGSGNGEEKRRGLARRRGLSEPRQSMLARAAAVSFQAYGDPAAAAKGQACDALQRGS